MSNAPPVLAKTSDTAKPTIRGVLFDKDGTLVDFDRTWGNALHPVMAALSGGDAMVVEQLAAALLYDLDGRRFAPHSPLIGGTVRDVVRAWRDILGRRNDPTLAGEVDNLFTEHTLRCLTPIGDPSVVLRSLRDLGLAVGLATNDTETNARLQLAALDLDDHMTFVAGFDSGYGGKPGPGMVLAFAATLGVKPSEVALVGDTLHDMGAARAAGAVGIAVLSGPMGRAELDGEADHVVGSIADLPTLLADWHDEAGPQGHHYPRSGMPEGECAG